jgi:hypothetical protein
MRVGLLISGNSEDFREEFDRKSQALREALGKAASGQFEFVALRAGDLAEEKYLSSQTGRDALLIGSDMDLAADPNALREAAGALVDLLARRESSYLAEASSSNQKQPEQVVFDHMKGFFERAVEGQVSDGQNISQLALDVMKLESQLADPSPFIPMLGSGGFYLFQNGRQVRPSQNLNEQEREALFGKISAELNRAAALGAGRPDRSGVESVERAIALSVELIEADPAAMKRTARRILAAVRALQAQWDRSTHSRFLDSDLRGDYLLVSEASMNSSAYLEELTRFEYLTGERRKKGELTSARFEHRFVPDGTALGHIRSAAGGRPVVMITRRSDASSDTPPGSYLLQIDGQDPNSVHDVPLIAASIVTGGSPLAKNVERLSNRWFRMFPRPYQVLLEWIHAAKNLRTVGSSV